MPKGDGRHYIDRGGWFWDAPRGHLPHVTVIDDSNSERPKTARHRRTKREGP
jgi:hypothetical protein